MARPMTSSDPEHERTEASGRGATAARARTNAPDAGALVPPSADRTLDASAESRRDRHRRETFERLVRAARDILFSRGLDDVRIADITEAADVGKGTFFNYFESKEDVVSRLLAFNRRGLAQALEQVRAGTQTAPESLKDALRAYLCPETGDWLTYERNIMRALVNDDVRGRFSEQMKAHGQYYETLMTLGQEQGSIRTDVPSRDLAQLANTFVVGLTVMLWIHGTAPTPALVDQAMGQLETVLRPPEPRPAAPTEPKRAPQPAKKKPDLIKRGRAGKR
jgi:AcrR family transcriptional regulator